MRVLHLTRGYPPTVVGGLSLAVGRLVRALQPAGDRHGVISLERGDEHRVEPEVWRVADVERASLVARGFAPDLVHVHDAWLWPVAEALRVPTVLTLHVWQAAQDEILGRAPSQSAALQQRALRGAHRVIAPSHAVACDVEHRCGVRCEVIGLGVEVGAYAGPPAGDATVLYVGRLAEVKGVPELLAAASLWGAQVSLRLAAGLPANPRAARRWQRRWETQAPLELRRRVHWLGWLGGEELSVERRRAALVVVPSRYETFGLSALESMAQGAVVIANRTGALGELIEHDLSGWLVDLTDRARAGASLAHAVDALLGDAARSARLSAGAHARAKAFTWESVVQAHRRVYAEVAGR